MWLVVQSKSKPRVYLLYWWANGLSFYRTAFKIITEKEKQMSYANGTELQAKSNIVWKYSTSADAWEILNLKFNLHIK